MATSAPITDTSRDATLEQVPCIQYPVQFRRKNNEDKNKDVRALIDLGSEFNAIYPVYATKLGHRARKIDLGAQKINASHLDTFRMVIADCSVQDKLRRVRFFQEIFLLANIGLEIVLGMFFLTFSKVDIRFAEWELVWRTYTAAEALSMTRKVEIIDKKEFTMAALNKDNKTFVEHVAVLVGPTTMLIYPSCQAQVNMLTSEKIGIFVKYSDFSNVFSSDFAVELPKHTGINDHLFHLLDDKQPPYCLIYSLGLVELEILKTYIKANLASGFIRLSKSPTSTPILFIRKKDNSLHLYVDY